MRILPMLLLATSSCIFGCNQGDPTKDNDQEAKERDEKQKMNNVGLTSHSVVVKAHKIIDCKDWITDPAKFAAGLKAAGMGKEDTVVLVDHRKTLKKSGLTSACKIIRAGKPPSIAKQKAMSKSTGLLGVLPGDPWCDLRAYCSIAEQKNYGKICKSRGNRVNKELGVTACVRTSIMGKYDMYSYRLVDKDTKCLLEIRGGHSIKQESKVRACAKLAMEQFTKATLKKAKSK